MVPPHTKLQFEIELVRLNGLTLQEATEKAAAQQAPLELLPCRASDTLPPLVRHDVLFVRVPPDSSPLVRVASIQAAAG